jgi:two-component system, NtrC family, response regulator AtoC
MKLGALDYLQKPFDIDELLVVVNRALDHQRLRTQHGYLLSERDEEFNQYGIVGRSRRVQDVIGTAQMVAKSKSTVLITGETGTGKELAARAVHACSTRAERPFVALNCAAITESLLENELFGHGKGAFTGAAAARPGLIEHASGGTLFLDEIGAMSKALQAKLLRALESGEVRRIGENESRRADVRFVAATNVDLKAAIEAGDFRSDLYYRLNVHRIHMPPLRERGEDVRVLVDHFVARFGREAGVERCGDDAWALLSAYDFPGNVRQLEHIIQRAVVIAQGPELRPEDLPEEVAAPPAPTAPDGTVAAGRERADKATISATLARHGGEIGAAARELQVSRTTMWRLMKKYGIGD